jgi:hypothetical protein
MSSLVYVRLLEGQNRSVSLNLNSVVLEVIALLRTELRRINIRVRTLPGETGIGLEAGTG